MTNETDKTVTPSGKEFTIPIDLLKTFHTDVRMFPVVKPTNGYIIFDREMLISVLRSNDAVKQKEVATQLEKLGKAGGSLVIMQQ
jgi:hypothetical protein